MPVTVRLAELIIEDSRAVIGRLRHWKDEADDGLFSGNRNRLSNTVSPPAERLAVVEFAKHRGDAGLLILNFKPHKTKARDVPRFSVGWCERHREW